VIDIDELRRKLHFDVDALWELCEEKKFSARPEA